MLMLHKKYDIVSRREKLTHDHIRNVFIRKPASVHMDTHKYSSQSNASNSHTATRLTRGLIAALIPIFS
ncbi:hypothetical protein PanWU01x14_048350 [Parasponia andersonii]|uniref:Uncharacterized protein n=1 Tax=Parasponia andersonii TaxID=3476 RepID=A0A2P5DNC7_PARAD|nr:hypothetical protein PanWU01x14_048350 [Parasponia andersonii]